MIHVTWNSILCAHKTIYWYEWCIHVYTSFGKKGKILRAQRTKLMQSLNIELVGSNQSTNNISNTTFIRIIFLFAFVLHYTIQYAPNHVIRTTKNIGGIHSILDWRATKNQKKICVLFLLFFPCDVNGNNEMLSM